MQQRPDITVIITTFNNCSELKRTLDGFSLTDRSGIRVEVCVVDNNSRDQTRKTIEQFAPVLPIRGLFEQKQGKCAALNRALSELHLGEIVFFTDDDVDVPRNLFHEIRASVARNQNHSVFGGRIHLIWPAAPVPGWAEVLAGSYRAYSHLDLGTEEREFPSGKTPLGTNWWVRRQVLEKGYRFDERVGPGSIKCSMGDEIAFLLGLRRDEYRFVYTPTVSVGHRVPAKYLTERVLMRQGLASGIAAAVLAYDYGFGKKQLGNRKPLTVVVRAASLVRWCICYFAAFFSFRKSQQMVRRWDAIQGVGWNIEALRIALRI